MSDMWAAIRKRTPGNHIVGETVETIDGIGKVFGFDYKQKTIEVGFPVAKGKRWKTKVYQVDEVLRNLSRKENRPDS